MRIKFKADTIADKKIRKKGTVHEIEDDTVAGHIITRGFGEEVKGSAAAAPAPETPGGDEPGPEKKGKRKKESGDGAGSET